MLKLARLNSKTINVVAATGASQLIAALGIGMIPILGRDFRDVYAIGLQVGSVAVSGIALGVVYNLAIGRPGFDAWRVCKAFALAFSTGLAIVTILVLTLIDSIQADNIGVLQSAVILVQGVGGGILALAAIDGVKWACHGVPAPLSAVSILPNVGVAICLPIVYLLADRSQVVYLAPSLGWLLAALATLCLFRKRQSAFSRSGSETPKLKDGNDSSLFEHTVALVAGVAASSVLPTLMLAAVTQLGEGSASWVFVVSKVCASLIGLGVNSVLLARYNWEFAGWVPGRWTLGISVVSGVLLGFAAFASRAQSFPAYFMIVSAWTLLLTVSALLLREVNARRVVRAISSKVIVDLTLSSVGLILLMIRPSIAGYFAVLCLSQLATVLVCSLGIRQYALSWISAAGVPVCLYLIVNGW